MKNTIAILFVFISVTTYAQKSQTPAQEAKHNDRFSCQRIELSLDEKKIYLAENVKIKTHNLVLTADSAVFDNENKTLLAFGIREFTFSGGEAVIAEKPKNIIRYKLNDDTIYID
jgi:lipopolysaccharide assembly outer membrane protein LptD (OstA)